MICGGRSSLSSSRTRRENEGADERPRRHSGLRTRGELVARFLDPQLGRFVSRDPLGAWTDSLGSAFTYAEGDPLNGRDPHGLDTCGCGECWQCQSEDGIGGLGKKVSDALKKGGVGAALEAHNEQTRERAEKRAAEARRHAQDWFDLEVAGNPHSYYVEIHDSYDAFMHVLLRALEICGPALGEWVGLARGWVGRWLSRFFSRFRRAPEIPFEDAINPGATVQAELGKGNLMEFTVDVEAGQRCQGLGRELFRRALNSYGKTVRGVRAYWGRSSTNRKVYEEALKRGLSPREAALETPTGKWAAETGYTEVNPVTSDPSAPEVVFEFVRPGG